MFSVFVSIQHRYDVDVPFLGILAIDYYVLVVPQLAFSWSATALRRRVSTSLPNACPNNVSLIPLHFFHSRISSDNNNCDTRVCIAHPGTRLLAVTDGLHAMADVMGGAVPPTSTVVKVLQ